MTECRKTIDTDLIVAAEEFMKSQVNLESDFATILEANLWNLYVREDDMITTKTGVGSCTDVAGQCSKQRH